MPGASDLASAAATASRLAERAGPLRTRRWAEAIAAIEAREGGARPGRVVAAALAPDPAHATGAGPSVARCWMTHLRARRGALPALDRADPASPYRIASWAETTLAADPALAPVAAALAAEGGGADPVAPSAPAPCPFDPVAGAQEFWRLLRRAGGLAEPMRLRLPADDAGGAAADAFDTALIAGLDALATGTAPPAAGEDTAAFPGAALGAGVRRRGGAMPGVSGERQWAGLLPALLMGRLPVSEAGAAASRSLAAQLAEGVPALGLLSPPTAPRCRRDAEPVLKIQEHGGDTAEPRGGRQDTAHPGGGHVARFVQACEALGLPGPRPSGVDPARPWRSETGAAHWRRPCRLVTGPLGAMPLGLLAGEAPTTETAVARAAHVAVTGWPFDVLADEQRLALGMLDLVLCPSEAAARALRASAPAGGAVIEVTGLSLEPAPVDAMSAGLRAEARAAMGIAEECLALLVAVDPGIDATTANVGAGIAAFLDAFEPTDRGVALVLPAHEAGRLAPHDAARLAADPRIRTWSPESRGAPRCLPASARAGPGLRSGLTVPQPVSPARGTLPWGLFDAALVPQRASLAGEAVASAMLSGLPVAASAWGAHQALVEDATAWPVDTRDAQVPVEAWAAWMDHGTASRRVPGPVPPGALWCAPEHEAMVEVLRSLREAPDERAIRSRAAAARARDHADPSAFARRVAAILRRNGLAEFACPEARA
ncbi:MAG: hypothetical protein AAFV86_09440 [Pseudomonadota bacterium]